MALIEISLGLVLASTLIFAILNSPTTIYASSIASDSTTKLQSVNHPKLLKNVPTSFVTIARGSSFPDNKNFFMPTNLTIEGNTTVIWINNDTVLHTVTSGKPTSGPSGLFDSSYIQGGQKYNHTFTKNSNYEYFCTLHPFMTGSITVLKQTKVPATILNPDELPTNLNVTVVNGSSFPNNGKFFVPPEVRISINGTIIWKNNDTLLHTVTAGKPRVGPSGEFDSGYLKLGERFNRTFGKTGIYDYYSSLNPYMIGKVIAGYYQYNLKGNGSTYPVSYLITGNGNQIQRINIQENNPVLEIRLTSISPGNLTIVIPRNLLDKVDQNGKDDAFGIIGNRATSFNETSSTPLSRTVIIQFDKGVNYIQILGSRSFHQTLTSSNETQKSQPISHNTQNNQNSLSSAYEYENKAFGVKMALPQNYGVYQTSAVLFIYPLIDDQLDFEDISIRFEMKSISQSFEDWIGTTSHSTSAIIKSPTTGNSILETASPDGKREIIYVGDEKNKVVYTISYPSTFLNLGKAARQIADTVLSIKNIGASSKNTETSSAVNPVCNRGVTQSYVNTIPCIPSSSYLHKNMLGISIEYPPTWKASPFLDGALLTPPDAGNTSMYITSVDGQGKDLSNFFSAGIDALQSSAIGTVDVKETSMFDPGSAGPFNVHFVFKDATFKDYIYEHQKTYVKHGDRIFIIDFAADTSESFQKYFDTANSIISSSFNVKL